MSGYHPTRRDLQIWRILCREARRAAANPRGPGGDLRAQVRFARKAVAPSAEALSQICVPLIDVADKFAGLSTSARLASVRDLIRLADALGPLVGGDPARGRPVRRKGDDVPGQRLGLHLPIEELPDDVVDTGLPRWALRSDIGG